MECSITANVKVLCARFNGAKHVLPAFGLFRFDEYEVEELVNERVEELVKID